MEVLRGAHVPEGVLREEEGFGRPRESELNHGLKALS